MKFKFTYLIEDTLLYNEDVVNFDFPIKSRLHIRMYRVQNATNEIREKYSKDPWVGICETSLIKKPNKKNYTIFEFLAKDQLPPGVKNDEFTKLIINGI